MWYACVRVDCAEVLLRQPRLASFILSAHTFRAARKVIKYVNVSLMGLLCLALDLRLHRIERHALGALECETERAVPEELAQDTDSAAYTEKHRVVVVLLEAEVREEDARVSVYVGPRVLGPAHGGELCV